ncbi:MAG: hypothetical protein D6712_09980 [Chloroflexi bacterium]|nr:MAG: hypothetical protein D6712_09980 [Chloroflexota bacterium]
MIDENPPLEYYEPLWTTEKDDFVLVRQDTEEGITVFGIFHRESGEWFYIEDVSLHEEVTLHMLLAGVEVIIE